MAVVRQITDGTTTVDFNDDVSFKLVHPLGLGVGNAGEEVTFVISALWKDITQDAKGAKRIALQQLLNKARDRVIYRRNEDWVWIKVQNQNETNPRYSIITGGLNSEDGDIEQGNQFQDVFRVAITRDAEWLNDEPTASGTASVNGTTIYNKSDTIATAGDNWVTIADLSGDAPALMKIEVQGKNGGMVSLKIGGKYGSTAHLNGFNPWLNAADMSALGGGSLAADAAAAEDERLELTATGTAKWDITAAALDHYQGSYRVFAIMKQASGIGSATVGVYHGSQSASLKTVDVSSSKLMHDLGTINIPDFPLIPSITSTAGVYEIALPVTITGTATVYVYALALVPLEASFFITSPNGLTGTDQVLIADGFTENTYLYKAVTLQVAGFPLLTSGRYIKMRASDDSNLRLYFFADSETTTPTFNDTMVVTVRTKASYLTSRGNGA